MKYLIVGGVAGGASAAARLRRLDESADITIFERGPHISYANCGLPYYIGNVITQRDSLLVQKAASFSHRFNIKVNNTSEVTEIDTKNKRIKVLDLTNGGACWHYYDKLLLAPGASPLRPDIPGIGLPGIFTVRDVKDADNIKTFIDVSKAKRAFVIGAGFIGLEMVENLVRRGLQVTLFERQAQVLPHMDFSMAALVHQHLRDNGVQLELNTSVSSFEKTANGILCSAENGKTLEADLIILSLGVKPESQLAVNAGIKTGERGGIIVNPYMQTSDKDIYAVGDAIVFPSPISGISAPVPLAGPANKQARIAAGNMKRGNTETYKGSVNTSILKVFNLSVAFTGLSGAMLGHLGQEHQSSVTFGGSHASYIPGSTAMVIRLIFTPLTGAIRGAQIIGDEGVDKRIDLISSILSRGGTIDDLAQLEHAYAPTFSSAKDPVNIAGFAAQNIVHDKLNSLASEDLDTIPERILIDVRTTAEFNEGTIAGAWNIPLDGLRERIHDIPAHLPIVIFCQQGMRAYLAQRILVNRGYARVFNLSGGFQYWKSYYDEKRLLKNDSLAEAPGPGRLLAE